MINKRRSLIRRIWGKCWRVLCAPIFLLLLSPCSSCSNYRVNWPNGEIRAESSSATEETRSFKLGGATHTNYEQKLTDRRVTTLIFRDDPAGPSSETIDLRGDHPDWPHFLIILDGVPFELVKTMYDEGHFRLFAPPVRVASGFPAMTDPALSKVFHSKPCYGFEAQYYDRKTRTLSNGNDVYLSGDNAPWQQFVTYCAPQSVAVNTYLSPWSVFSTELAEMDKLFSKTTLPLASAYSVGTAGVGTREGEAGARAYLNQVDQLCERITYDRRGKVRFTITADHGQGLQQCEFINFEKTLADAGFQESKSLKEAKDVVVVSYGLVTCAELYTDQPRAVAEALARDPAVDLATFREGDRVFVLKPGATAAIEKRSGGFAYDTSNGDPLELTPIIDQLRTAGHVAADGTIADHPLLEATAAFRYPDPLYRIWECFNGTVLCPPDVVASLKSDKCTGSKFFHFFVNPVASTHGSLESRSGLTFLLTNAVPTPLPDVIRSENVLDTIHVQPQPRK